MTAPEFIDRYQILQTIGSGGMGSLYLARDPKIGNRRVVIKLLREGFDNPALRERFAREADAAGGLHHINVVTIFDVGEYEGQPFIAMQYIEGETLGDLIRRTPKLSLVRKLQLMEELCAGLHYAHRGGVVHRDIKPANIMVDQDGVLKILDFGIARLGSSSLTQAGLVMGTLNYMAPEQMAGEAVDARADMFSAGAVFYELLSYQRAFPGELPAIVHKITTGARAPLATLVPEIDADLVAIVDRCLAPEAGNRYSDMATVRRELAAVRERVTTEHQTKLRARTAEAQNAIERADFDAALEACRQALTIDSDDTTALELQLRARASLDERQAREWLTQARADLDRGAFTAASMLVEQAVALTGAFPEALAMRKAVDEARRQLAEMRARETAVAAILARAQDAFDKGLLDVALHEVNDALEIDADNRDARGFKDGVVVAVSAKLHAEQEAREQAEWEARATAVVQAARRQFASGQYAAALALLEGFHPPHPIVTDSLGELRAEARDIEHRRIKAELGEQRPSGVADAETIRIDRNKAAAETIQAQTLDNSPTVTGASLTELVDVETTSTVTIPRGRERVLDQRAGLKRWKRLALLAAAASLIGGAGVLWRAWAHPASSPSGSLTTQEPDLNRIRVPPRTPTPPPSDEQKPPATTDAGDTAKEKLIVEARSALEQKRYGSAVSLYRRLAGQFPNDPIVRDGLERARTVDVQQAQKAKDLIRQGDRARQAREYDEAIRLYQAAISEYPEGREAIARLNQTRTAKTLADAVAAEILRPGGAASNKPALTDDQRAKLFAQANALIDARLIDAAIAVFDQILAVEPNNEAANLGKNKALALKAPKQQ